MKRILALLMAAALLACLAGCGKEEADKSGAEKATAKAGKAADAKGPFTFAGVRWDTPIGDCEAALEKATGVQFTNVDLDPDDPNYRDPTFSGTGRPSQRFRGTIPSWE